ncbi:MAG: class I SAM-dependent methyltransferase [Spirochaetia bacterium]|nr:class I SAM-dependent methyltransferase [Spirochaetia bacterium]
MRHVPYARWAGYLYARAKEYFQSAPTSVVDLACGTGKILYFLARRVPQVTGLDRSRAMLKKAKELVPGAKIKQGLLQGPMPFKAASQRWLVSTHDCLNYLTDPQDLHRHFQEVGRILVPGGLYSTDTVSLANIVDNFHGQTIHKRTESGDLVWTNDYDRRRKILTSELTFTTPKGQWTELHLQRYYSVSEMRAMADDAGLSLVYHEGEYEPRPEHSSDAMINLHFARTR